MLSKQHGLADTEHKLKLLESSANKQIEGIERWRYESTIDFSGEDCLSAVIELATGRDSNGILERRNSISNIANCLYVDDLDRKDQINYRMASAYRDLSPAVATFIVNFSKSVFVFRSTLEEMDTMLSSIALQMYWKNKLAEYEAIFDALTIDYRATAENGKFIVQQKIVI